MNAADLAVRRVSIAEALPSLRPALKRSPWGGLVSLDEILRGAQCFQVCDVAGVPCLTYGVEIIPHAGGTEALIVAAAGHLPGVDLTDTGLRLISAQAKHCDVITAVTRRPALIKKMHTHGFKTVAVILAKASHVDA